MSADEVRLRTLYQQQAALFLLSSSPSDLKSAPNFNQGTSSNILSSNNKSHDSTKEETRRNPPSITNSNVPSNFAQSLLRKSLNETDCVTTNNYTDDDIIPSSNTSSTISQSNKIITHPDHHCMTCGIPYHHPSSTSTIRIRRLKRGASRKRRSSRQTAKRVITNRDIHQKHRNGGRNFLKQISSDHGTNNRTHGHGAAVSFKYNMNQIVLKEQFASLKRMGDGLTKNCAVYKCGYCDTATKFKGVGVLSAEKKNILRMQILQKKANGSSISNDYNKREPKLDRKDINRKKNQNTSNTNKGRDRTPTSQAKRKRLEESSSSPKQEDFISLEPKTVKRGGNISINNNNKSRGGTNPTNHIGNSNRAKKKKQKQTPNKKTKLMNFLSSLND